MYPAQQSLHYYNPHWFDAQHLKVTQRHQHYVFILQLVFYLPPSPQYSLDTLVQYYLSMIFKGVLHVVYIASKCFYLLCFCYCYGLSSCSIFSFSLDDFSGRLSALACICLSCFFGIGVTCLLYLQQWSDCLYCDYIKLLSTWLKYYCQEPLKLHSYDHFPFLLSNSSRHLAIVQKIHLSDWNKFCVVRFWQF